MSEEIHITIKPDGTFTVEVNGVKGVACKEITEHLTKGKGIEHEEVTSEYFEQAEAQQFNRQ